jgi:pimeloyl-ACP methyl ester carboxylesterase
MYLNTLILGCLTLKYIQSLDISMYEFWVSLSSWHEIGMYDLPAMVDYVLRVTGHSDLHFVGHSMGATIAVVMLSERPQYNDKLKITILLAPVIKLEHNTSIFRHSAPLWKALQVCKWSDTVTHLLI